MAGVNIPLTADNKRFIAAMQEASGAVGAFAARVNVQLANSARQADYFTNRFNAGFGRLADRFKSVGQSLTIGFTAPLLAAGGAAYKTFADIDALERSLSQYGVTLKEVKQLAKLPGLGIEEAAGSLTSLLSVKYDADLARRALMGLGNALTLTGKGKAELEGINTALAQMKGKGKVSAEEINQIAERLPMIRELMQKAFGTADTEALQKMGLSADKFLQKITDQLEKLPKATAGPKAIMENFFDSLKIGAFELGKAFERNFNLSAKFEALGNTIDGLAAGFAKLEPGTQRFALTAAGLTAALGPLSLGIGAIINQVPTITKGIAFLTNPITLAVIAVGALAAGFYSLYRSYNPNIESARSLANVSQEAGRAVAVQTAEINRLSAVALDESRSQKERLTAYSRLQAMAPERFRALQGERIETEKLKTAVAEYTAELLKSATAKAAQSRLEKLAGGQFDINEQIKDARKALEEAKTAQSELANIDAGMGNPTGTAGQSAVSTAARKLANLKGQLAQNVAAQKELAEIIRKNEVVLNVPKPTPIPTPIPTTGETGIPPRNPRIAQWEASMKAEKEAFNNLYKGGRLSFIGEQNPFNFAPKLPDIKAPKFELGPSFLQPLIDAKRQVNEILRQGAAEAFAGMGQWVGGLLSGTAKISDLPKMLLSTIGGMAQQLGRLAISIGIGMKAIKQAFMTLNPAVAIAAGVGLIALGAAFQAGAARIGDKSGGVAKFANGGIVYGPTLGLMGEYASAKTNPEVVAPLDRLGAQLQPLFRQAVNIGQGMRPGAVPVTQPLVIYNYTTLDGQILAESVTRHDRRSGRMWQNG